MIPRRGDAAFKYTEDSQVYWHHLGHPLHRVSADIAQTVDTFWSADGTVDRRIYIGSGVEDLSATIRWDGQRGSFKRFLAAARRGVDLEYFPSLSSPSLSFPCKLLTDSGIGADSDFWWEGRSSAPAKFRRTDGGTWDALTSPALFYYLAGNDLAGLTFTRSGTVGPYVDEDGVVQSAAANLFRTTWIDSAPHLLLEDARTNLVTTDDFTSWSDFSGTLTPTTTDGPDGSGSSAYTLTDDNAGSAEAKDIGVSYTGDGVKSVSFTIRQNTVPSSGQEWFRVVDADTGYASRLNFKIDWSGTEPSADAVIAGTYLGKRYVGDGYWTLYFQTSSVTAANDNRIIVAASSDSSGTGAIDVYRINTFDDTVPSFSILDAGETRNADTFYADWPYAPQAMTAYVKFREMSALSSGAWASATGILSISNSGWSGSRIHIYRPTGSGDVYAAQFYNGTTAVAVTADVAPGWGDEIELCMTLTAAGVVQLSGSNEGATTVTGTASSANGLPSSWSDSRLYAGSLGASNQGLAGFRSLKFAPGVKTLTEMRAY